MRKYCLLLMPILALIAGCGRGYMKQTEEFAAQVKSMVNPDELQSWATNILSKTPITNKGTVDVKQEDIPKYVRGIYKDEPPEFVEVVSDDTSSYVLIAYGGGFGHWGLYVGYPSFTEKSDQNFYVVE